MCKQLITLLIHLEQQPTISCKTQKEAASMKCTMTQLIKSVHITEYNADLFWKSDDILNPMNI